MAPVERFLPRFVAEPPQEDLPYGRWEERLTAEFLAAALRLDSPPEDLGEPGPVLWFPDRTWHGRTYVPGTAQTSGGYELFGYVRFVPGDDGDEPADFAAEVDFTDQTAERNPDWEMDLCDEVIGAWRGHLGAVAAMTLVWGRPLVPGGVVVTAELADLAVDQCEVVEDRFTLLAPDDYRGDLLEIRLFDRKGRELARESLYAGDDDEADEGGGDDGGAGAGDAAESGETPGGGSA